MPPCDRAGRPSKTQNFYCLVRSPCTLQKDPRTTFRRDRVGRPSKTESFYYTLCGSRPTLRDWAGLLLMMLETGPESLSRGWAPWKPGVAITLSAGRLVPRCWRRVTCDENTSKTELAHRFVAQRTCAEKSALRVLPRETGVANSRRQTYMQKETCSEHLCWETSMEILHRESRAENLYGDRGKACAQICTETTEKLAHGFSRRINAPALRWGSLAPMLAAGTSVAAPGVLRLSSTWWV